MTEAARLLYTCSVRRGKAAEGMGEGILTASREVSDARLRVITTLSLQPGDGERAFFLHRAKDQLLRRSLQLLAGSDGDLEVPRD